MPKSITEAVKETGDSKIKKDPYEALARQCQAEYNLAWKHQKPKKDEQEVRLKLYNNQKRDKKAVGDTTMFTIHQTVVASLYVDRLDAEWEAKEEGDEGVAENLDALSKNDYDDMEKDIVDYNWIWDAGFFGRSLVSLEEYIREPDNNIYLPLPHNIDPIVFLRDPYAVSVNGDRQRRGSARFFGWEQKMTKRDMEEHPHIFDTLTFSEIAHGGGTRSILRDAIEARIQAQGLQSIDKKESEEILGANAQYDITKWYTHYEMGGKVEKVKVWLANDRAKVIGIEKQKQDYWQIIDRPLYPHSHDWDGTSIPDLTEDKQRARAVAQNLGLNAMKADLYPMYIYDSNKITNKKDLKFAFNKFIPVDAKNESIAGAIAPLIKSRPNLGLLDFIYNSLDISAQKATATPELQQGAVSQEKRTLGEINIIASKVDTRYSLSAKIFSWSEKRFWRMWYQSYKDNFKEDIDEKVLRIVGAFGTKWRKMKKEDIVANIDPDVRIESRVLSRAKQLEERQGLTQYFALALQEPTANRRWGLKKLARLNGLEKDEIDRLFPPTVDERIAEEENEKLSKNEPVPVLREDDHNVHLEINNMAADTTAKFAHIRTHVEALSIKKVSPELFPTEPVEEGFQPSTGGQQISLPQAGQQQSSPITPSQTSGIGVPAIQ
jgi:hypothetical protein